MNVHQWQYHRRRQDINLQHPTSGQLNLVNNKLTMEQPINEHTIRLLSFVKMCVTSHYEKKTWNSFVSLSLSRL